MLRTQCAKAIYCGCLHGQHLAFWILLVLIVNIEQWDMHGVHFLGWEGHILAKYGLCNHLWSDWNPGAINCAFCGLISLICKIQKDNIPSSGLVLKSVVEI